MHTKKAILTGLLLLNGVLAAALWLSVPRTPAAFAQARVAGGGYLAVTAKPDGETSDVVWVLDTANDKLSVFYPPSRRNRSLAASEPRDLRADFGRQVP